MRLSFDAIQQPVHLMAGALALLTLALLVAGATARFGAG